MDMEVTVEQEIQQLSVKSPHVVILGAGASRAACPNGDNNGNVVPLMADFLEVVPIRNILDRVDVVYKDRNFEEVYSELAINANYAHARIDLERAIFDYFKRLQLPKPPNIYDHILMSLRGKDVIATFNWDPFLIQSARRIAMEDQSIPLLLFLHGNVMVGFCPDDNLHGVRGNICSHCGEPLQPSNLLYPVSEKNYEDDPMISDSWDALDSALDKAFMVTVFGYSAPTSDVSANNLLSSAWGPSKSRALEQFEIVDIRPEKELVDTWDDFIHTHHYEVHNDIFDSWMLKHPRRSGEAFKNQYLDALFIEDNPVPKNISFKKLREWYQPLLDVEKSAT